MVALGNSAGKMDYKTDQHDDEVETIDSKQSPQSMNDTNPSFSVSDYLACIVTGVTLFTATAAILLRTAPRWAWLVVLGIIFVSCLMIQRRPNGVVADIDIRKSRLFTILTVVLTSGNFAHVYFPPNPWVNITLTIYFAGLLGLWFVPHVMTRHRALVWMVRSYFFVTVICISLGDPQTFALYLAQEGKRHMILSTLGFGLQFYWLRLSHVEFMWKTTTLAGVVMPFWICLSGDIDVRHVVVFNAAVHSTSLLAFVAVSDRRYRTFSKEWIHAAATENASGIFCAVMCIAIYCHLTSQMLLFALLLAGCCPIVLLVRRHDRQQAPAQRTDDIQQLRSKEEPNDDAIAIERFQRSFKPFVAWAIVTMIINFALAAIYPALKLPLLHVIAVLVVTVTFRCYLVDSNNQGRVRWLFGWLFVGCVMLAILAVVPDFAYTPDVNIDVPLFVVSNTVAWMLAFLFFNIGGLPDLCRVIILLVDAYVACLLPIDGTIDDYAIPIVGGMIFGELVGRLSLRHGRVSAIEKAAANNCFQSSFKHFVIFSAIFALLELRVAALKPTLAAPCALCVAIHIATVVGRWYLRGVTDLTRARWLFGWGWAIVSVVTMATFALALQQQTLRDELGTGVISVGALMWLLTLIYLNIVGAPWLARWMMLCLMPVLVVYMPSSAARTLMPILGAMIVGEVVGQLWVQCRLINVPSFIRWWSLAFEDEAKEREYVTKHFEESYSSTTVCCAVTAVLSCAWASRFPNDDVLSLSPLAFSLGVLFLRFHTERTVLREDKRAYFGFGMVILTLLMSVIWAVVRWASLPTEAASPLAVSAVSCCVIIFVVIGKLMCLPERHRQGINLVILGCQIVMSPWSTLGTAIETTVFVVALLVSELIAFTLEQKRRASHQATDSLRRELHSKQAQMKLAVDTIPMPACITDDHMNLVYANCAALSMFGYTEEEITRQHVRILMMGLDAGKCDEFVQHFRRSSVSSTLGTISHEVQGKHKDGSMLELCLTLSTSPDRMFFMATFRDLAAKKTHVERQRNMKLALDTTPSPIAMANSDLKLTYTNKAMCTIFGYTEGELVGHDIKIIMDKATRAEFHAAGEAFRKTGKRDAIVIVGREVQVKHKDGRTLHLRLSRNVTDDGKLFVTSFQDMSAEIAQREATAAVAKLRNLHNLREMTKKRDIQKAIAERFKAACAFLSHEIRNQLHPQSMVLEDMKAEEPARKDSIDMILAANATVTNILTRVLDLAKWESGEFPIDSTHFPIVRLFNGIAAYARANGVTVKGLARVEPTWHVSADEHLLKQAATNLVSNATKFSDGRPVSVVVAFEQTNHEEGVIVVTVIDKGRGMKPEQLSKVMMPFCQIRKAGEAGSGTGLGLPLTKAMIETGHKGSLTLVSEGLGKGTTAIMRVPVQWEDRHEEPRQEFDPLWWVSPHPGATADVLVVDDSTLTRVMTIRSARKMGLTFHQAADGAQAVECLRSNTYSMVFMDHEMPVMNGAVATKQARANGYTLPIVMTSGNTFGPSKEEELKLLGVTEFLGKMSVPGTHHAMQKLQRMKIHKDQTV